MQPVNSCSPPWYLRSSMIWPRLNVQVYKVSPCLSTQPHSTHLPTLHSSHMGRQSFSHQLSHWHTFMSWCPISCCFFLANPISLNSPIPLYSRVHHNSLWSLSVCCLVHPYLWNKGCVYNQLRNLFPWMRCYLYSTVTPTGAQLPHSLFWGFSKYPILPGGKMDREEFKETETQASIDNSPYLPVLWPWFWA